MRRIPSDREHPDTLKYELTFSGVRTLKASLGKEKPEPLESEL